MFSVFISSFLCLYIIFLHDKDRKSFFKFIKVCLLAFIDFYQSPKVTKNMGELGKVAWVKNRFKTEDGRVLPYSSNVSFPCI